MDVDLGSANAPDNIVADDRLTGGVWYRLAVGSSNDGVVVYRHPVEQHPLPVAIGMVYRLTQSSPPGAVRSEFSICDVAVIFGAAAWHSWSTEVAIPGVAIWMLPIVAIGDDGVKG
jgi:hypothetical protein